MWSFHFDGYFRVVPYVVALTNLACNELLKMTDLVR